MNISEKKIEWRVFALVRKTKHYDLDRHQMKEIIDGNVSEKQGEAFKKKMAESIYKDDPFFSMFPRKVAGKLMANASTLIDLGKDEGNAAGAKRFGDYRDKIIEVCPDFADATIAEMGFPLFITDVTQVSRNLVVNNISSANFTIGDIMNVSPSKNILLGDSIRKIARYERPYHRLDDLDDDEVGVALKTLYQDYFSEPLVGHKVGQSGQTAGIPQRPKLWRFLSEVMKMRSVRDPGGNFFNLFFKDRRKLAISAKVAGNYDSLKLLLEDYIQRRYDLFLEDMTPIWIFAKRPPLVASDRPRWTFFFHGFIKSFSFTRAATANTYDATFNCQCPLGYFNLTKLKSNYVVVDWCTRDLDDGAKISRIADDTLHDINKHSGAFFERWWQGKNHEKVLHHFTGFINGSMTFFGLSALVKSYGKTEIEGLDFKKLSSNLLSGKVTHKDFFRLDYIYIPNNEQQVSQSKDTYTLPFSTPTRGVYGRSFGSVKVANVAEEPSAEVTSINSPWLWAYDGHDLNVLYNPADYKDRKKDSMDDDLGWLCKQGDVQKLAMAWWIGIADKGIGPRKYSMREKFLPKVKIDVVTYPGSVFASYFANQFTLENSANDAPPLSILTEMATTLSVKFFSDAQGNLCFASERPDDLAAIRGDDFKIRFSGWTPFANLQIIKDALGVQTVDDSIEQAAEAGGGFGESAGMEGLPKISEEFGLKIKEAVKMNPLIFGDHDNRYIIAGDFFKGLSISTDTGRKITMASQTGQLSFFQPSKLLELLYLTGYSGVGLYEQTKYGFRPMDFEGMAPHRSSLVEQQQKSGGTLRELEQTLAAARLRRTNAAMSNGSIELKYQTLLMQPGRMIYLPDMQLKGLITGISDTLQVNPPTVTGTVNLEFVCDIGKIVGNPYLEILATDPYYPEKIRKRTVVEVDYQDYEDNKDFISDPQHGHCFER